MEQKPNGFWGLSTFALILIWLYLAAFATLMLVFAFRPDSGTWDIWGILLLSVFIIPVLLIPVFLFRAFRQKRSIRFGKILPWIIRVIYISLILAISDCWLASTERGHPLFSRRVAKSGDFNMYQGFGYIIFYHHASGRDYGPEVWFWFTPFTLEWTSHQPAIGWLWTQHNDD